MGERLPDKIGADHDDARDDDRMALQAGQVLRMDLSPRNPPSTTPPGFSDNRNGRSGFAGNRNKPPTPTPTATSTTTDITAPPITTSTTAEVVATSPSPRPLSETGVSPTAPPPPPPASSTESTLSPTPSSPALTTTLSQQNSPTPTPTQSSITTTSVILTPPVYSQISSFLPTQSFIGTTLQTTFTGTSSTSALPIGIVPIATGAPAIIAESSHETLGPGQKAGIAVGIIVGLFFIITLITLLFRRHEGQFQKALPWLASKLNYRWTSRSRPAAEISDSLLTPEAGSRGSLGWDYRSTFAQPIQREKPRRSLPRSLRRFVRFNPLGENPITPNGAGEGTPSRNSFASFFRRRSTASTARSMVDVESLSALPPLPRGFLVQPPAAASSDRSILFEQNDTGDSIRPPTIPSEVLPPTFHRSWCYRNSQTTMASEDSEARSFKSVPGWVKFHYPRRLRNDAERSQNSWRALSAPKALSPGLWLKAKFLRHSQSLTASGEKVGSHVGTSTRDNGDESASTESPVLGKSEWKQTQETYRMSYESIDSLVMEKQQP